MFVFSGDQHNVFSELSALRRQLRSEQKRLEVCLQQGDWEELDSPLSDRSESGKCITLIVALLYLSPQVYHLVDIHCIQVPYFKC